MANNLLFNRDISIHRRLVQEARPKGKPADVKQVRERVQLGRLRLEATRYLPNGKKKAHPTLFYIPGTAFIAYGTQFTEFICSHICKTSGYQVIELHHRLAPEHQFPKGINDAYRLMKYFLKRTEQYQIDEQNVAIAGYSTGANFAASLTIQAHRENLPLHRQILISPLVDFSNSLQRIKKYKTYKKFNMQDSDIGKDFVRWFENLYLPPGIDKRDPRISPFWHQNLKPKMPVTDIIVAEFDRYRMDAEAYYDKLKQHGVDVRLFIIDKENHTYFWRKSAMAHFVAKRLAITDQTTSKRIQHVQITNSKAFRLV